MSDISLDWSFGGQLKRYRIAKGHTLRAYSRLTGIDSSNLSHMEQGRHSPPPTFEKMCLYVAPLDLSKVEIQLMAIAAYNFHRGRLSEKWRFK